MTLIIFTLLLNLCVSYEDDSCNHISHRSGGCMRGLGNNSHIPGSTFCRTPILGASPQEHPHPIRTLQLEELEDFLKE